MSDERIGEGFRWKGLMRGKRLEGLPSFISVTGDEGLVKGGLECGDLVRVRERDCGGEVGSF